MCAKVMSVEDCGIVRGVEFRRKASPGQDFINQRKQAIFSPSKSNGPLARMWVPGGDSGLNIAFPVVAQTAVRA